MPDKRTVSSLGTVSAFVMLSMAVSACGGSSGSGASPSASGAKSPGGVLTLSGQALVNTAKKEGQLTLVTSLAGKDVPNYVNAFEQKYPFIHVNVNRGASSKIVPAAINEMSAGKSPGDVFETTSGGALEFAAVRGGLSSFNDPNASDIPAVDKTMTSGNMLELVADRVSYVGFGWNTSKIPASVVPTTFKGLLNPALKGKMGIEIDDTSANWVGLVLHEMGKQNGEAFLKQLGAEARITQNAVSGAEMMSLIASGQYGASPSVFQSHAEQQQAAGAPVKWHPLSNVAIANVGEMGIFKAAKNPAAALLFIDFITSKQGRQVVINTHLQLPETKMSFQGWIPTAGYTAASYAKAESSWANLQKADFGS